MLHELGRLYHQYEQSDKAVEVYNRISEIAPTDLEAIKLGKDASARASMKKGGWTEAESYRDLIKDKDAAVSLEQQSRMQLSDESLEEQIDETFARHEAEPQSVDLAKRLGLLHDQKEDLEGAIAWYQYAVDLTNKSDPGLVRKVADLKMKQLERQIREDEQYLAEHGKNDAQFAQKIAALETAKKQRAEISDRPMRANGSTGIQPTCNCATNWANSSRTPANTGTRFRNCSAPARIQMRA